MGGKQKMVVSVPCFCCEKCRYKALQTVAGVPGLSSVSLEGAKKDRLVVTGEEIDICRLIKSLEKKVGCVELLTVGPVEDKKPPPPPPPPPEEPRPPPKPTCSCQSLPCFCQTVPRLCPWEPAIYVCELCDPEPICVIM
eukprot:TRINITY_DN7541_c0_g2_i2.p1 TRINITY_DN7541_c0_g2~~TRINITY_DN7541_c0_g2_i2.p1  ORF type:complete len:139 (-),score=6.26 TRINITY_DN7541_c0_g2_i2:213-629(-)